MKLYEDLYRENSEQLKMLDDNRKEAFNAFLSFVDNNYSRTPMYKIACSRCYIEDLQSKNDGELRIIANDYRKYIKSNKQRIDDMLEQLKNSDFNKFNMSGIWEVIMYGLVFMYLGAVATKTFVVNSFVDGVVATLALAIAVRSTIWRYRIGRREQYPTKVFKFEIFTIIFCFVIKFLTASIIDLTFVFLLAMFYFTKKQVKNNLDESSDKK